MLLSFLLIVTGCLAVLYWYSSQQCKQLGVVAVRRECRQQGAQLLDQTVQQVRLSLSRDQRRRWRFWREYRFEYSYDGVDRYEGRLLMLGHRPVRTQLESSGVIIH